MPAAGVSALLEFCRPFFAAAGFPPADFVGQRLSQKGRCYIGQAACQQLCPIREGLPRRRQSASFFHFIWRDILLGVCRPESGKILPDGSVHPLPSML